MCLGTLRLRDEDREAGTGTSERRSGRGVCERVRPRLGADEREPVAADVEGEVAPGGASVRRQGQRQHRHDRVLGRRQRGHTVQHLPPRVLLAGVDQRLGLIDHVCIEGLGHAVDVVCVACTSGRVSSGGEVEGEALHGAFEAAQVRDVTRAGEPARTRLGTDDREQHAVEATEETRDLGRLALRRHDVRERTGDEPCRTHRHRERDGDAHGDASEQDAHVAASAHGVQGRVAV